MGWAAWTAGLQDQRDGDHWLRGRFQSALIQSGTLVSQRSDEMRNVHSTNIRAVSKITFGRAWPCSFSSVWRSFLVTNWSFNFDVLDLPGPGERFELPTNRLQKTESGVTDPTDQ